MVLVTVRAIDVRKLRSTARISPNATKIGGCNESKCHYWTKWTWNQKKDVNVDAPSRW